MQTFLITVLPFIIILLTIFTAFWTALRDGHIRNE